MSFSASNKRIAKNTLMLYLRQILVMLVSLYTVRVLLGILGVEDYGIYNVVGGLVVMFSFLNSAMTQATQRFLNFAMGQNDTEQVRNVYSISFLIHILIAVVVIILAETAGLWFFYNWLNIPIERQSAAFVAYQFSVVATAIGIFLVPYRATIIAYEKMSFFAMISIVEVFFKLGIVFLLPFIFFDKLTVYAFLVAIVGLVLFFLHKVYCNKMFETAHFRYCRDKQLFQHLIGFSGWLVFGQFANVCRNQGINVLINIFHGVILNAAMGIANQVNTAVYTFVTNFQTAVRPQIIKSYAAKEYDIFMQLIFRSSKASFYLLFLFFLPLYINADFVLQVWLKNNVPEYSIIFTRLILFYSLEIAIGYPLAMSVEATGNIKKYQIVVSSLIIINLPLSLLFLWLGFNPAWVLIIKIGLSFLVLVWRIFYSSKYLNLSIINFLREVIVPILVIAGVSSIVTTFLTNFFIDWTKLILSCIVSTISIGCLVYYVGINKQERVLLRNWINIKIKKKTTLV